MKSCRRAWNVAARRNPGKLPSVNPFSAMGLQSSPVEADAPACGHGGDPVERVIDVGQACVGTPRSKVSL
jgi:hypothetical protein